MDYEKMSDRELDKAVAVKVMGWKPPETKRSVTWLHPSGYGADESGIPAYSTNIFAAFTVVEHLRQEGWRFRCGDLKNGWTVEFYGWKDMEFSKAEGEAFTLQRAICIAALKSITT